MAGTRTPQLTDLDGGATGSATAGWWRAIAITAAGLALALGLLGLIWLLARPLTLVLVALIIAQALMPVVGWLERWMPRTLAVVLVYLLLIGVLAGGGWLLVPTLVDQAQTLSEAAPALLAQVQELFDRFNPGSTADVVGAAQSIAERFGETLLALPLTVFSVAIDFILVVFMSAYWLISAPALHRFTLSLFPEDRRDRAEGVLGAMGQTMGGFVRGEAIDAVIVAVLAYIGLTVIGIEYTLVLAIIVGFGELLPVIGPIITSIPAILIGLAESPERALIVAGFFLILQQVESNIVLPLVMRSQADVPPLLSLVAILAGSALGGLLGAIIAIPLAGALRVLIVRVLAPAEREWSGADDQHTEVGAPPPEDDDEEEDPG